MSLFNFGGVSAAAAGAQVQAATAMPVAAAAGGAWPPHSAAPRLAGPAAAVPHASTAGHDMAAEHSSLHLRKKERKAPLLSPAEIAVHRGGWSRLVRVRDFVAQHAVLRSRLHAACDALESAPHSEPPDLDVDDLRVHAPFERIEKDIAAEMERANQWKKEREAAAAEAKAQEKHKAKQRLLQQQRERRAAQYQQYLPPEMLANPAMTPELQQAFAQVLQANAMAAQMQQQQQQQHQQQEAAQPDNEMTDTQPAPAASQQSVAASDSGDAATVTDAAAAVATDAAASSAPGSAAAHSATRDEIASASQLQPTQPALLSQSSVVEATGASAASTSSAMGAASTPVPAAPSSVPVALAGKVPPDFGASIPSFRDLLNPLQPLLEARATQLVKRARVEANCLTMALQEREKIARTAGRAPKPLADDEVILRVAIYHPQRFTKQQEFLVLGSQPLTDLRDALSCVQDRVLDGPHTHSSCFFIEGVFYDDLRQPSAIRLSDTVLDWLRADPSRATQRQLGSYRASSMAETTFADLSLRLGAHYFFQHQADCRHVCIVTEMRMAHAADERDAHAYPRRMFQAKTKRQLCGVCAELPAAYVAYGDKLASASPFFYCEQCYTPLHYNAQGALLYADFQVFPYEQD